MLWASCGALGKASDISIGTSQKGVSTQGKKGANRTRVERWAGRGHARPMGENG